VAPFVVGSVVAGEHDDGIVVDPELLELIANTADADVDALDHAGEALLIRGPIESVELTICVDLHAIRVWSPSLLVCGMVGQ